MKIVDTNTVELTTHKPEATFLQWLPFLGVVSQEQIRADGVEKAVGTGPYRIVSFSKDRVVLRAESGYWGGEAKAKNLVYLQDPKSSERFGDLETGKVNIISTTNKVERDRLVAKGFKLLSLNNGSITFLLPDVKAKTNYVTGNKNPFQASFFKTA